MTKTLRPNPSSTTRGAILLAAALLLPVTSGRALEARDWKNRQTVTVDHAGVIKLVLPPATLGLARPGLEDLRLLDPAGHEVPFVIEHPAPGLAAVTRAPRSVRANLTESSTQLTIETGSDGAALDAIILVTPARTFIKAVRVEISTDGEHWELVRNGALIFRQFGAEELSVDLEGRKAAQVRVALDDARSAPIPLTGAIHYRSDERPLPCLECVARAYRHQSYALHSNRMHSRLVPRCYGQAGRGAHVSKLPDAGQWQRAYAPRDHACESPESDWLCT